MHRDVKAGNVLLAPGAGQVRIACVLVASVLHIVLAVCIPSWTGTDICTCAQRFVAFGQTYTSADILKAGNVLLGPGAR